MAEFKYIGQWTKPNGKVDVKIGSPGLSWYIEFLDVEPNVTIMEVTNQNQINCLLGHKDVFTGDHLFEQVS